MARPVPGPTEPFGPAALTGMFIGPGAKENKDEHVDLRADYRLCGGNLSSTFTGGHPYLAQAQRAARPDARLEAA